MADDSSVGVATILAIAGGCFVCCNLLGRVLQERLWLSDPMVAMLTGIVFGPVAASRWGLLLQSSDGSQQLNIPLTMELSGLVVGIQVFIAAVQLPPLYPFKKWIDMLVLLGPTLLAMSLLSSLFVWVLTRSDMSFLECFVVGATMGPTDPVLASSIVSGRFARLHIHNDIRWILVAESGANDGFSAVFVGLPLMLLQYGAGGALRWFWQIFLVDVAVTGILGFLTGCLVGHAFTYSEKRRWLNRRSFAALNLMLSLCVLGAVHQIRGLSAIFAVFMTGLGFAWRTADRHRAAQVRAQETVDSILTYAYFLCFGAILPWPSWTLFGYGKLVGISLLVLLFRRLPLLFLFHNAIPETRLYKEAAFVGWFGPIGVSAIFYSLQVQLAVGESFHIFDIVSFVVFSSVMVHGMTAAPLARFMASAKEERIRLQRQEQEAIAMERKEREREEKERKQEIMEMAMEVESGKR